jgi:hypothetical protein
MMVNTNNPRAQEAATAAPIETTRTNWMRAHLLFSSSLQVAPFNTRPGWPTLPIMAEIVDFPRGLRCRSGHAIVAAISRSASAGHQRTEIS